MNLQRPTLYPFGHQVSARNPAHRKRSSESPSFCAAKKRRSLRYMESRLKSMVLNNSTGRGTREFRQSQQKHPQPDRVSSFGSDDLLSSPTLADSDKIKDEDVDMASLPSPPLVTVEQGPAGASGGVKIFMGFRADCAKCQARTPGHYMHYVKL